MLTLVEKIIFILAVLASGYGVYRAVARIVGILGRGQGHVDWKIARKRLLGVLVKVGTFQPVFRFRFWPSLFHNFVAWGFIYYMLVNVGDVLEGFFKGFRFLDFGLYRLGGDFFTVAVLGGMLALAFRRFVLRPATMNTRDTTLLHPKARAGIIRDSSIVSAFILTHVGTRFLGATVRLAAEGPDPWQPFASAVSTLWRGASPEALVVWEHVFFWLAIGTILAFLPYFLYSKHIHLFFGPLNFLLKPERRSIGELSKLNFADESIEQFGATRLEDLGWEQLMDGYACIMCYRCQEICPAYSTGKKLSPAALEINKRYFFNSEGARLAKGEASQQTLLEFAIPAEAVWACTACGACIDICPMNNEPMRDIMDIRRSLVLMDSAFPDKLQTAFRGMERTSNPWNIPPGERMAWAKDLNVPTIAKVPEPDILWWVGCAPATDARAQKTARAFAQVLAAAGVNYAVLGEQETCTGDSARRAGNEFLFNEMASANVEMLNEVAPKRIVTTCPHCLHTLKNEYPAFGGNYEVIHHTQFINELLAAGKLKLKPGAAKQVAFHDPCYLSRHNHITQEPRQVLKQLNLNVVEMPHHGQFSFCCGAGGAQMWKEEEEGEERVSMHRFQEAVATQADTLAVGCPFCLTMFNDAAHDANSSLQTMDIAELVAQSLA